MLLKKMIDYARAHGLKRLTAITMSNNRGVIILVRKLGLTADIQLQDGIVALTLSLELSTKSIAPIADKDIRLANGNMPTSNRSSGIIADSTQLPVCT